ncbi:MAG TPA: ABC transporter ATP-binding protein [Verrucomicrobiota bacterium]|nr:ABC transporter ATP-binding protein [Verrucomicrobiota bacterium]HNT13924.1 ABC transporter ATP-binding protein [Verrucomicrobiota bacterium]
MSPPRRALESNFAARKRSTMEVLRRVAVYLAPYPWLAFGTVLAAVLSLLASFAFPKLTQFAIDEVIGQKQGQWLAPAMIGLLGAFLLRDVFNSARILINNQLEQNVIFDMRRAVYARLQRLPIGYFDQRATGDLLTRIIEDVNAVERVLIDGLEQGVVALFSVIGVAAFLFYMNPVLALVAMAPMPVLAGGALWYTLTAHRRYRRQREASSAMNALLMDNLQGIRQIKAFNRQGHEDDRFGQRAAAMRRAQLGIMRIWAIYGPSMGFAGAVGYALVLWVGGSFTIAGQMTSGELVGFLLFLHMFYAPIGQLHSLNQMLQSARAAGERVFDVLDAPPERQQQTRRRALSQPVRGAVVYDDVSFQYDAGPAGGGVHLPGVVNEAAPPSGAKPHVLKRISLQAQPGEMIALVGPTGAGKSSLVNLLPAFYEPTAGRILVDGQDISEVALASLREHISVVSQEPFLFNGTIRENIQYGKLAATEAELLVATRAANCHEFIQRLPHGFETAVGERGVKLSVGEKQRVSIARALLKNAPILILDEATASVDTATERLIQEALEHLMRGRTSFVIAHRLSTIRNADQILVLRHGEIVERGRHEALLQAGGLYARLAQIQSIATVEEGFGEMEMTS